MTTQNRRRPKGPLVRAYHPPQELLDEFAASLVGMTYDDITVLAAKAEMGSWSDDEHIFVELVISDPAAGQLTWPVASIRGLRMQTRERADDAGIEQFLDITTTGGPDDAEEPEPERPPGPGREWIPTSEDRFGPA
jgi:hypothetical protein